MKSRQVSWSSNPQYRLVSAQRSALSAAKLLEQNRSVRWFIVLRSSADGRPLYYAYRQVELEYLLKAAVQISDSIESILKRAQSQPSAQTHRRSLRDVPDSGAPDGPAARIVDFDAERNVAAIGEWRDDLRTRGPILESTRLVVREPTGFDLGVTRGVPRPAAMEPPVESPAKQAVVVSAETRSEVTVDTVTEVNFRIEPADAAQPLAVAARTSIDPSAAIVVSISTDSDAVEIAERQQSVVPPAANGAPATGHFLLRAIRTGIARLAVMFRQGASELATLPLVVEVVTDQASTDRTKANATAEPRRVEDDDALVMLVEQRVEHGQYFYEYRLYSEALDLHYLTLRSPALLDRGDGPAKSVQDYVDRIYERLTRELRSWDDAKQLAREVRALGINLCEELFDPDVARQLWPLRQRIARIQLTSWEFMIPWEVLRLRDPNTGEVDDKYLAEYGLIRTPHGKTMPRKLTMKRWGYLFAEYESGSHARIGAEREYFEEKHADRDFELEKIEGTHDSFYEALTNGNYDVLHLSCHAASTESAIDRASLVIGEQMLGSTARSIEIDTITVAAEARLESAKPVVFLNACETGRTGPLLTGLGGWPSVFLKKGASAFIGTSWAVRDKPAAIFAEAFYDALLSGATVTGAAAAARNATRDLGDASWLAFKIFAHPLARRV